MGQKIHDQAGMVGGEVLGHHVAHSTGGRQLAHQLLQRLQTSGGGADAHHMPEPRRTGRLGISRPGGIGIGARGRSRFRRLLHRAVPPEMFGKRLPETIRIPAKLARQFNWHQLLCEGAHEPAHRNQSRQKYKY